MSEKFILIARMVQELCAVKYYRQVDVTIVVHRNLKATKNNIYSYVMTMSKKIPSQSKMTLLQSLFNVNDVKTVLQGAHHQE